MLEGLRDWYDRFRGAGDHAITVPPMGGALRSNSAIEEGDVLLRWPEPDNVVLAGGRVVFSSGNEVFLLAPEGGAKRVATHKTHVTALAADGDALATACLGGEVSISGGRHDGRVLSISSVLPISCPVALLFENEDTLLVCNGSDRHDALEWRHDLLTRTVAGSVWRVDLRQGTGRCIASGLAWPRGLALAADGAIAVSEAWRSQITLLRDGARSEPVLTDLPAYPGGMCRSAQGGFWIAFFAPRRRLTELVMREPAFRDHMIRDIEPQYWISPSLRPMSSYYEPLQGGTLKKLATLKPWAPSRSYGLVVEVDSGFNPLRSFHSRADGTRHGISSCLELDGRLVVAATGGDVIVSIDALR